MAKGQKEAADKQLGLTNNIASGYGTTAAGEGSAVAGGANNLIDSEGFDPTTLSAITNAGMGGVNAAAGSAGGQIQRDAARTKNPAGTAGALDTLAIDKGVAGGKEAGDIQIQNAQFKNQQRTQGLNLLNNQYGTNVDASSKLYGMGAPTLQARAAGKSGVEQAADLVGAVGKVV